MHDKLEMFIEQEIPVNNLGKSQIQYKDQVWLVYEGDLNPLSFERDANAMNQFIIRWDEYNQCTIHWYQKGKKIVELNNINVVDIIPIKDEYEESLTFRLKRLPSKMFKIHLDSHCLLQFGAFFEVCEDCD